MNLQKYLALAPDGVSIVFETAALSAIEIEHLMDLVSALAPEFKAAGIRLHSWGPDYATGMRILYTSDTPETPRSLVEKLEIYGPGTVTFQVGSVVSLADFRADTAS